MPTNLPAEARAKWLKYLEARTPEEKLTALQEFFSAIPKHKGTENLRAWVRRKISELKEELEEKKLRRSGSGISFFIEKEGAAQVIMLGMTQAGKSSLLRALTNAKPEVSDVPYTTKKPVPGMMRYEDIYFQVVESPALVEGSANGAIWWGTRVLGLARNADVIMLVIDLTSEPLRQAEVLVKELETAGICLKKPRGRVLVRRSKAIHGIKIVLCGKLLNCTVDDVRRLLEAGRMYGVEVKIYGEVTLEDVEKAIYETVTYKPCLIVLNKADSVSNKFAAEVASRIREKLLPDAEVVITSVKLGVGVNDIPRKIFKLADIVRVYTKEPNSPKPSPQPLILKRGSTVEDAVRKIREEFIKYFKYAKVWGPSAKYPGERVGLNHVLEDGDVIEIRTTVKGI
ncbi:MAG: TGS domain-containing protein [Desulfurococcales archaeon]|nr:TGS domain-containing protein [Desulfurococcales archaeon]